MKSDISKNLTDVSQSSQNPRSEYEVKAPLIQSGVDKVPGNKVKLTAGQADTLRKSGHIV